jgi:hypothetical protein
MFPAGFSFGSPVGRWNTQPSSIVNDINSGGIFSRFFLLGRRTVEAFVQKLLLSLISFEINKMKVRLNPT